jgi:uncharacterized repeat protein (TIGR01451 family)
MLGSSMRGRTTTVFLVAALLMCALPAAAQVAFDAASNATPATVSTANPIAVNWNHTVGLSKKPYIVVQVSMKRNGGAQTVATVTYGTEAGGPNLGMALIGAINNGTNVRAELWGLANPTPGTHQITVSVTNGAATNTVVTAGARSFSNVFQTAPTGTVVTATGNTTTPTVAVTNTPLEYVIDAAAFNGNNALTVGAGQTNSYNVTNAAAPTFSGAGSIETGSSNITMSWTAGAAQQWATLAVPLHTANPQVLYDAVSSTTFAANTNPVTGSWNHTTTTAANRYLVVGVSIDRGGANSVVNSVRYGTEGGGPNVLMTAIGAGISNGTSVRTELWGLVAPASGTHQITVSVSNATTININVVAGAQTFSNVEQNAPVSALFTNSNNSTTPTVAVTNTPYDYVVDAISYNANQTLTEGPAVPPVFQDKRYGIATAAGGSVTNFSGAGSGARGYTNVTMAWTPSGGATTWAQAAVAIKQATVGLRKTASADVISLGQTVTYTLVATNYSAAAVNNVIITDAIPAGSSFVSQTGCAGTGPVSCNIGTLAAGASSAPITITVVPTAAGTVANVATVAWNGIATTNSSETVNIVAQSKVCATPGKDGAGGTLAGIKNDYWPGSASSAVGATSLTVGARNGAGAGVNITAGDLLIVMQMQDAAFDTTNDETYGEGTGSTRATGTGSGAATTLNNAGRWEYAIAVTGTAGAGGTFTVSGGGPGGGLLYSYTTQTFATTTTQGQRTFQVIRVPQYTTATLGSTLTAAPWNGATGGVLAVDISGTLALGGATVSVNGLGFRGAGGRELTGDATVGLANTDFRTLATLTTNGGKGEGIAGTPRYVYQHGATIGAPASGNAPLDTGVEGYVGGSYGRGAPGNAGGGSTDGVPTVNGDNSGGGGGGNGGFGGAGGHSWNSNLESGGQGGGGISPSLTRITMGGGGGAGTTNNGSAETCNAPPTCRVNVAGDWTDIEAGTNGYYSSGANGGGTVIIRALQATGTGTITANGFTANNVGRDGGGGGGAGGSILFTVQMGALTNLTLQAKGGNGGNAWLTTAPAGDPGERHGPGGGGGGGYILTSSTPSVAPDVSPGANGVTNTVNDEYGAQPGTIGVVQTIAGNNVLPGGDGATCAEADLTVTNTAAATVRAGNNLTYTQTATNNGPNAADGVVYMAPIPASSTFVSMSVPPGWTCITPAVGGTGVVTCTTPTMASGATANFSLVVNSNISTPAGYLMSETNSISSNTPDSNPSNNQATANTIVEASVSAATFADMAVTITQSTSVPIPNQIINYTQTITNNGSFTAANPSYTFTTPPNTTFQGITPPAGWTCITPAVGGTGVINCTGPATMASGVSVSMPLSLRVNPGATAGTTITATPSVSSTTQDPYMANNTASVTSTVVAAGSGDVAISISNSPNPVYPGEDYDYTVVARNNGPNAAANISVSIPLPTGTNFQSLVVPVGWACTPPAVGSGGTITCTIASLAAGASATFSPVARVNYATTAGTTLPITATITTTTTDSIPANNSASTTNLVVAKTSADVAIVKTDSPDPVGQGQLITYRLAVTNNGPATATNVSVSDPLPANVTLVTSNTSIGSCSGTTTITCSLGTLNVGNTQFVNLVVQANFGFTGTLTNTATVTATETDSVPANNSSTALTTVLAVTVVHLRQFTATQNKNDVQLNWVTSFEADNLGFNVYRDVRGVRTKINPGLIAGSFLTSRRSDSKAGFTYRFRDKLAASGTFAQYYLEDVDARGVKTMNGPISPSLGGTSEPGSISATLGGLGSDGSILESAPGMGVPRPMTLGTPSAAQKSQQVLLAATPGLKIFVTKEGWHRVTRAAMIAGGFTPPSDLSLLGLYTLGAQHPFLVEVDAIAFYGFPLDSGSTGARTYWLRNDQGLGKRYTAPAPPSGGDPVTGSQTYTFSRTERSVFVAALVDTGESDNMYGPVIYTDPTTQTFNIAGLDTTYGGGAILEVTLQGATDTITHQVNVSFNGTPVGTCTVPDRQQRTCSFALRQSAIPNGANNVTLTALNGDNDVTVLVNTRLTYQHLLRADSGALQMSFPANRSVTVGGFTNNTVTVLDVTDPANPLLVGSTVAVDPLGGFAATFTTPGAAKGGASNARVILAVDSSRILSPNELVANGTSGWGKPTYPGADLVIIANSDFSSQAYSLASARAGEGITSAVIDVDDVYDEYNFGMRSPQAIRDFMATFQTKSHPAKWLLLIGDASIDPRNYFGLGAYDFIPTKLVRTTLIKTASDDWFTDFNNDGIGDIPVGRIPVRTGSDASLVVGRITSRGTPSGTWANSALLIADVPGDYDFPGVASSLAALLPPSMAKQTIDFSTSANAHGDVVSAMNSGQLIVDYIGHASTEIWSSNVFSSTDAAALGNGSRLPFAVLMNCLNGYFHDLYTQSLAEALLEAPSGGAIAVWASSTLTQPDEQALMNRELIRQLTANPTMSIGEAVIRAKQAASDPDVRKSWIYFGDPSMKLK